MEMMNAPKAVVMDLDGTLLRSDGTVSRRTLAALARCREMGIITIIATARFWFRAQKLVSIIAPDYAVLADGTQIYQGEKLDIGFPMDRPQSDAIISELAAMPEGDFVVSTGKTLLCSKPGIDEPWRKTYDFTAGVGQPVYKIAAVFDTPEEANELAARNSCRIYSYRGENLYGFTSTSAGKYQAVCALAQQLGIMTQDIIAFGDDENDLDILKLCGTGVAMGNAVASVRAAADSVTAANDEDGVAAFLEQFVLK